MQRRNILRRSSSSRIAYPQSSGHRACREVGVDLDEYKKTKAAKPSNGELAVHTNLEQVDPAKRLVEGLHEAVTDQQVYTIGAAKWSLAQTVELSTVPPASGSLRPIPVAQL